MSEQINTLASGGRDGRPHFLQPSWGKVGMTLLVFMGIAVVLHITTFIRVWCSDVSTFCWGPGLYVLVPLIYAAHFLGGWPLGVLNLSTLILAGIYFLVCLWARPRPSAPGPHALEGDGMVKEGK